MFSKEDGIKALVEQGGMTLEAATAKANDVEAKMPNEQAYVLLLGMNGNDVDKARAEYWKSVISQVAMGGGLGGVSTDPYASDIGRNLDTIGGKGKTKARARTIEYSPGALADNAEAKLDELFSTQSMGAMLENAKMTSVDSIIVLQDPTKRFLMDGAKPKTVIPEMDPTKLEGYAAQLEGSAENQAAYQRAKEAIEAKTPVSVYINSKASGTVKGVTISAPGAGGKKETKSYSLDQAVPFILTRCAGIIPKDTGVVGMRVKKLYKTASNANSPSVQKAKVTPQIVGKAEAIEAGKYQIANIPVNDAQAKARGLSSRFTERSVPTDLTFKIVVQKANGEDSTRTVRVKGKVADYPVWALDPKFQGILEDPASSKSKTVTIPTTPEAQAEQAALLKDIYRAAVRSDIDSKLLASDATFTERVRAIASATPVAGTAAGVNL